MNTITDLEIVGDGDTRVVKFREHSHDDSLSWRTLNPQQSQRVYRHAVDGFGWGHHGSGASQLALAILLKLTDEQDAVRRYQEFKEEIIACLRDGKDFAIRLQFEFTDSGFLLRWGPRP